MAYSSSAVEDCYNSAIVKGWYVVSGVVGLSNGTVNNCYNNGSVSGEGHSIGGVVGTNNATVENCYNAGSVTGTGANTSRLGGVVGNNSVATVQYCHNTGSVSSGYGAGGVVGVNHSNSTVKNCYNTGSVSSGRYNTGGVVEYSCGIIKDCYNAGSVNGNNWVGGIVATLDTPSSTVENCYNSGSVSGSNNIGSVVGFLRYGNGTVTGCYYDKQMCTIGGIDGSDESGKAEGKLTTEMLGTNLNSLDTLSSWVFTDGLYPRLASMETTDIAHVSVSPMFLSNNETIASVFSNFTISTVSDVNWSSSDTGVINISSGTATVTQQDYSDTDVILEAIKGEVSRTIKVKVPALTYGVTAETNAVETNGITATATFGSSPYVAGETATVTITLSGTATASGTHTVGLTSTKDVGSITAPGTVTKIVNIGDTPVDTFKFTFTMPTNEVDDLVVNHTFIQAQSTAPASTVTTVAKTTRIQSSVDFTLNSELTGTWQVYDAQTGGNIVTDVTLNVSGTTLTLSHASDIPADIYYASVTETGKTESTRLALTVNEAPTYGVSAVTNIVEVNGITATATFGSSPYVAGETATVTITLSGTAVATGTHTVGLTSAVDAGTITEPTTVTKIVAIGDTLSDTFEYTFTMPSNEVDDLVVNHTFIQSQSTAPTANVTTIKKTTRTQASVDFALNDELAGTWQVYDAQTGGNIVSDVTASVNGTTLTLSHSSDIPAGTYYVSVTETGKTESTRLVLTVVDATTYGVSATTNAVEVNGITATATVGSSPYVAGETATVTITLSGTATVSGTHTIGLVRTEAAIVISPETVTKTVEIGATPTDTFEFTFTMPSNEVDDLVVTHTFSQAQSTVPVTSVTIIEKTTRTQAAIDFTLESTLTGTWQIYDAQTGGNIVTDVTPNVRGTTLTLTHASDIPAGTYYVAVTETGKAESARLALTVAKAKTYEVSVMTDTVKVNGITATATVGSSPHVAGETATVTITLSGSATASGTHTIGLVRTEAAIVIAPEAVTKTVSEGDTLTETFEFTFTMPANEVNDLVVAHTFEVLPDTVPSAPTNVTAKAGNKQATVTFNAPSDDGGSPIIGYIVTSNPDNITVVRTDAAITDIRTNAAIKVMGLTNGTTYTFTVRAINEIGKGAISEPSNAIVPYKTSSGSNSKAEDKVEVLINGKKETVATINTKEVNGKTITTITLDDQKTKEILEKGTQNAVITIPANNDANVVVGSLNGQTVKEMKEKKAILKIKTGNVVYTLPASHINIERITEQLGNQVEFKDIVMSVKISEPTEETVRIIKNTVNQNNYQIVVEPVEFEISCTKGNKIVEVSNFKAYVERMIAIPESVDPSKITTGIVLNSDGTFSHVPTTIVKIDGKYYAKIKSMTNSIYSVIYNPKTFKDVENHWAKESINDMGSKLVINGTGNGSFEPDRDITRAEFVTILVKGLGLMRSETGKDIFTDVASDAWYYDGVSIAYEYGLIAGYENGEFKPMEKVTREQAMTIIARAMTKTKLPLDFKKGEVGKLLEAFGDSGKTADWAKNSVAACINAKIISGRSGKFIAPKENITRAEVAVIVRRLLQKLKLI